MIISSTASGWAAEKYTGPRPPKPDLPYLVHADNLAPTEASVAREEERKDFSAYVVTGAASSARTPLAEPIFLIQAQKLVPEKLSLYKCEVRNGNREVLIPTNPKKAKDASRPFHVVVSRLEPGLYRVEVDEPLENGEYTLSPDGSNDSFSFSVY